MMCPICHTRPIVARGRCSRCYQQARRDGSIVIRRHTSAQCACGAVAVSNGQCNRCYMREYMRVRRGQPQLLRNICQCGCRRRCRNRYCPGHNRRGAHQPHRPWTDAEKAKISAGMRRYHQQRKEHGHA